MAAFPKTRQSVGVLTRRTRSGAAERTGSLAFALASVALAGNVLATALGPVLVASHPLWLLLLDARNRHLALAIGAGVDATGFFALGISRALVFDPVFFALGRRHGDRALDWLAARSPRSARTVVRVASLFDRAGPALVLLSPNYAVCLAAGSSRMSLRRFLFLDAVGTTVQVYAVWLLGDRFREPLGIVVAFIADHALALTTLSIAAAAVAAVRRRRSRLRPPEAAVEAAE